MSEPHHHVFNALQQAITKSVKTQNVIGHLIQKGVIKENDRNTYASSKNGMKILIAFLRNKNYDTFLEFVDSIYLAQKDSPSTVQSTIVDSIIMAVQDFDQRNDKNHAERVIAIQNKHMKKSVAVEEALKEESLLSPTELEPNPQVVESELEPGSFDMPKLCYIEDPVEQTFRSEGGELYLKDYNFSILVPPLAVSEGREIKLKVGICCYGPFSINEDYLVASDFIVVVVDNDYEFRKPVEVSMEHCLCLPEYKKCNEVVILRASHTKITEDGLFTFDFFTNPEISSDSPSLWFETEKFCILCAALKEGTRDRVSSASSVSSLDLTFSQAHIDDNNPSSTPSSFDDEMRKSGNSDVAQTTLPSKRSHYHLRQRNSGSFERTTSVSQKGKRSKRTSLKRPLSGDSFGEKRYKCASIEYVALLIEPATNSVTEEYKFIVFISTNCPGGNEICMQQARKILKSNDIGVKTVPISFDQTLKFETNAKRGWDVYPDKTATVTLPEVQFYKANRDLLRSIDQNTCPPRILFTAEPDEGVSSKLSCKVTVKNASKMDTQDEVFFRVTASRSTHSQSVEKVYRQNAMDYDQDYPYPRDHQYPRDHPYPRDQSEGSRFTTEHSDSGFHHSPQFPGPVPSANEYRKNPHPHYSSTQASSYHSGNWSGYPVPYPQYGPREYHSENIPPNQVSPYAIDNNQDLQGLASPPPSRSNPSGHYYSQHSAGSYDSPSMARRSPVLERYYSTEDERDGALTSFTGSYELQHDPEDQLSEEEKEITVLRKFELQLSNNLKNWKYVARLGFGLEEPEIIRLDEENRTNKAEASYQAYLKWKMQTAKRDDVKVEELHGILLLCREVDAARNLIRGIRSLGQS